MFNGYQRDEITNRLLYVGPGPNFIELLSKHTTEVHSFQIQYFSNYAIYEQCTNEGDYQSGHSVIMPCHNDTLLKKIKGTFWYHDLYWTLSLKEVPGLCQTHCK